jgi:hypothetical protein
VPDEPRTHTEANQPGRSVLRPVGATELVMLLSAPDADRATVAFYSERQRLKHTRVAGDLLLVRQDQHGRPLLREALW